MTDYAAAYGDLRLRVTDLLRDRPESEVERIAPATPQCRVRDVVAHLGGVCDDVAHGNMESVATDRWTRAQVDKRRDWPFARVLDDWSEQATAVEPLMNDIGRPIGQMVFDAWTHEQDVRGALREPGGRDSPAMDIAFDWWLATARAEPVEQRGSGSLRLITERETVVLGPGEPTLTLRTTRFELLRTLTGRRSAAQVRSLDFDGPPLEHLLVSNDIFSPAEHDIVE